MTRHSERERDFEYMAWVKTQPCRLRYVRAAGPCSEGSRAWAEADHAGERAGFRRGADEDTIPLCRRHHADRTTRRGFFAGRTWSWMRAWCDDEIAYVRAIWVAWKSAPF